jgi:hypothetical protein
MLEKLTINEEKLEAGGGRVTIESSTSGGQFSGNFSRGQKGLVRSTFAGRSFPGNLGKRGVV